MTPFENAIKEYLDARAKEDVKFAEKYSNEKKSIEECCRFILGDMRKKAKDGCYGATDAEVFGLAVHYYDEPDIKAEEDVRANVVINREVTEEEKAEAKRAKEEAKRKADEEKKKRKAETEGKPAMAEKRKTEPAKPETNEWAGTLFDFSGMEEDGQ